jgi:hypothetical protein
MGLSLIILTITCVSSLLSLSLIIVMLSTQTDKDSVNEQADKEDIVSEYGCSLTLGVDKPSSVGRFEGIRTSPAVNDIKIYYCNVDGFDDIRLVSRYEDRPDEYEFIMRPGSTATITFLLDLSWLGAGDYMDGKEYRYKGIEAFLFLTIHQPIITRITYDEGVILHPTKFYILSDEYILVEYVIEVDEEVKERTNYTIIEGPYTYSIYPLFSSPHGLYITIRK